MNKKNVLETYIYSNNKVVYSDSEYDDEDKEIENNEIDLFDMPGVN